MTALQVLDDLFADAGAVSHAHGAAAAGGNAAHSDIERWFAEADADGDGRQVTMRSHICLQPVFIMASQFVAPLRRQQQSASAIRLI